MRYALSALASALIGVNLRLKLFAGLAQPTAYPSQPEADPSSGGLWWRLGLPARLPPRRGYAPEGRAYSTEGAINSVTIYSEAWSSSSETTETLMFAVTSLANRMGTSYSPTFLMGSAKWILRRSTVCPILLRAFSI